MAVLDNLFDILLPDPLAQRRFELADRLQSQHSNLLCVALCTLGLYAQVGQAGIGAVHQVQVSNYSPVPQNAVIAQPQMLFLVLDQHLNRPAFQIVGDDFFHRCSQIIRHQCNMFLIPFTTGEHDFDLAQFIQPADPLGQPVRRGFSQAVDITPGAAVVQDIPAVFAQLAGLGLDLKTAIRSSYADKMPLSFLAGVDDLRAQIECIEQDRDLEVVRQNRLPDGLAGQLGELEELDSQALGMFLFHIQQRGPRDRHAAIVQTDLDDGVAPTVLAGSMVKQFTDSIHLFGSLEGLSVINDEKQVAVFLVEQTAQQVQGNLLQDRRLPPVAAPEEFAVIGPVRAVSQEFDQSVDGAAVADAHGQHERPEIVVHMSGNLFFNGPEKTLQFFGNSADSNHTASMHITYCQYNGYRHERLFLFNGYHRHKNINRSV